ncbi:MAG TPA: MFS transporter [Verrucomicrobiae bacterium]|jgi:fucose permease|nr:MFS transporter [Verrucomicrobiae bacterium]
MKHNYFIVLLVMVVFVAVSFVTNIMDPIGTDIQASFNLTEAQLGYLSFGLFIAYAVMSFPAGLLAERFSAKTMLIGAFLSSTVGAFAIAVHPSFAVAIPAYFLMGVGFAILQVVTIPLLRVAGGGENMAFLGNLSQMIFALGSAVSPYVYVYLDNGLKSPVGSRDALINILAKVAPAGLYWVSIYWVIAAILLCLVLVIALVKWPRVELMENEKIGSFATIVQLLKNKTVWLYLVGVICYVGTEQGIATKIKGFLVNCHNIAPDHANKLAVSGFWSAMAIGCAVGMGLIKLFDSRKLLSAFMAGGAFTLVLALFTPNPKVALFALPMMGFWCSVGCPIVFALALNSLEKHHGTLTGILCVGIVGGGFVPPIIGKIADHFGPTGLRYGMLVNLVTLAFLFSMGFWARPLINNSTIGASQKTKTPVGEEAHV